MTCQDIWRYQPTAWRSNPNESLEYHSFNTITYGIRSTSCLKTKCLQSLEQDFAKKYFLGSKALVKDFYIDDYLLGLGNLSTAIHTQKELTTILNSGGFTLRKWYANRHTTVILTVLSKHLILYRQLCVTLPKSLILWGSCHRSLSRQKF